MALFGAVLAHEVRIKSTSANGAEFSCDPHWWDAPYLIDDPRFEMEIFAGEPEYEASLTRSEVAELNDVFVTERRRDVYWMGGWKRRTQVKLEMLAAALAPTSGFDTFRVRAIFWESGL